MEIKDMLAFMAVVENGSYTKASVATFVSQPSLSKSIQKLEGVLGVELLRRSTRVVELTDAGNIVYKQVIKIMRNMEDLTHLLGELKNVQTGHVKIGMSPLVAALYFLKVDELFHRKYPKLELHLMEYTAKELFDYIDVGKIDTALAMLPIDEKKYEVTPIIEDEYVVYMSKNHKLAKKSQLKMKELRNEPFILFKENYTLHDVIIQNCKNHGFMPHIAYKSSQWDLLINFIDANRGISILPKKMYEQHSNKNITLIPIVEELDKWQLGIVKKKNNYQSFAVKKFLELAEDFKEIDSLVIQ